MVQVVPLISWKELLLTTSEGVQAAEDLPEEVNSIDKDINKLCMHIFQAQVAHKNLKVYYGYQTIK